MRVCLQWAVAAVLVLGLSAAQSAMAVEEAAQEAVPLGVDRSLFESPQGEGLAGEPLERATLELSKVMRCPVCQGLSIADSPTPAAIAMKEEVRDLLAQGYSPDQVLSYFEASYGEFVRLEPKAVGFNRVVWIAPLAALLLGVGLIFWRLRSAGRGRPAAVEGEELATAAQNLEEGEE